MKALPDFDMVLFGGTGDLAMRKLLPALYQQVKAGTVSAGSRILAAARKKLSREAFLELAEPTIPDAIDAAVSSGATRVVVSPHFLLPGNHTMVDIPALVDAARDRHPGTVIELTGHLGDDPGLVELVVARLEPWT